MGFAGRTLEGGLIFASGGEVKGTNIISGGEVKGANVVSGGYGVQVLGGDVAPNLTATMILRLTALYQARRQQLHSVAGLAIRSFGRHWRYRLNPPLVEIDDLP